MLLHTLLRQFDPSLSLAGIPNKAVTGVREDSRQVQKGELFVARPGLNTDGRQYVADAAERGAVAVITAERIPNSPLPQVLTGNIASAASVLANAFHENPSSKVGVLGITGTNGKTTTAYLVRHALSAVGQKCGMIGTIEIDDGKTRREASMTTPSAVEIAGLLATMRSRGCWSCAMEVSSHALDQGRVAGVEFAGAAFTNLTGDHLDYHKTMEDYATAKARLFEALRPGAVAVINGQDKWADRMVHGCKARVIRFSVNGRKADYRARNIEITAEGSTFVLDAHGCQVKMRMPMIGRHNIANVLTAAALLGEACQMPVQQIAEALSGATGAPGRLQPVRRGQAFGVFVDYAHTDDGLKNVLTALRPLTRGKLRVLFGCGGDRDRTKRPRMARVAEKFADVLYVTSDNPRTEDPASIISEVIRGLSADVELTGATRAAPGVRPAPAGSPRSVVVEPDRRAAIERVLTDAREGDVVLLAGKGHENYQMIGTEKRHFDDVEEASLILEKLAGGPVTEAKLAS